MEKKILVLSQTKEQVLSEQFIKEIFPNDSLEFTFESRTFKDYSAMLKQQKLSFDLIVVFSPSEYLPDEITREYSSLSAFYGIKNNVVLVSDPYRTENTMISEYNAEGREVSDVTTYSELAIEKVIRTAAETAELLALPTSVITAGTGGGTNSDFLTCKIAQTIMHEYPSVPTTFDGVSAKLPTGVICTLSHTAYYLDKLILSPKYGDAYALLYANRYGNYLLHIRTNEQKPRTVCNFLQKIIFDL